MNMYKNLLFISTFIVTSIQANATQSFIGPVDLDQEVMCLAQNIYHEGRGEGIMGMRGIADVTLNRVKSIKYPNTICEVVQQGPVYESWRTRRFPDLPDTDRIYNPVKGMCQFSWWCDGQNDEMSDDHSRRLAFDVAFKFMNLGLGEGLTDGADHYHALSVTPKWSEHPEMMYVGTINNHIFYKYYR